MGTSMIEQSGLYDIYDIWHVPFWQTRWFYLVLFCLGALIFFTMLLLLVRWYRKRMKHKKISPWDKTLAALEQLKQKECATTEQGKAVYFTLTVVLKEYIDSRYGFDVQGKTDDELLQYLQQQKFEEELLNYLRDIAQGGVMVKFANVQAMRDEILRHLDFACVIVKQTIPKKK